MNTQKETNHSNSDSTNSLFSLSEGSYLNLAMNKSNYYYENDSIDKSPESEVITRPLTFNYSNQLSPIVSAESVLTHTLEKFVVILVGLPAVGKSTISNHLIQYLINDSSTNNLRCSIFNAGKVRRSLHRGNGPSMQFSNTSTEDIFNPKNSHKKEEFARITFERLINELHEDNCDLAIFDATNSTILRRSYIFNEIDSYNSRKDTGINITPIVLQISCSDRDFIRYNIHRKSFNEDYFDKPYELAVKDFSKRLQNYYKQFVPFTSHEFHNVISKTSNNGSMFYFNLSNVGLEAEEDEFHFNESCSEQVKDLVKIMEKFIKYYASQFGFQYIRDVNSFFKAPDNCPSNNTSSNYLKILKTVANNEYFETLKSCRKPTFA